MEWLVKKSDKDELVVKLAQNITDEISFPVKTDKELESDVFKARCCLH